VALAWLLSRPGTVVPILGARRLDHFEANLAGLDVRLPGDQLSQLDKVTDARPSCRLSPLLGRAGELR
jgi:aryl-alcohol dehydrogenase-like predicted oxidoreductase